MVWSEYGVLAGTSAPLSDRDQLVSAVEPPGSMRKIAAWSQKFCFAFCADTQNCRMLKQIIIGLFAASAIYPHQVSDIPAAATAFKAGRYTVSVKLDNPMYAKSGVDAEIIIPAGISSAAPAVVFFHGNSRDKKLFKKAADFLTKQAAAKQTILISVQNWWPLSGDHVEAFDDSRRATNLLIGKLAAAGIIRADKIFLSGFSAGGFTALASFVQNLNYNEAMGDAESNNFSYAGVISMKGNFHPQYFMPDPMLSPDARRANMAKLTAGKRIILTVGGKKDAPRVQKQAPECRDFLKDWGIAAEYHEFPAEGHSPDKTNLDLLWQMVNGN